jgi:hypothetical protein
MKMRNYSILLVIMMISSALLAACSEGKSTLDIDMQKTSFAQTADAQATLTAQAQPTATATTEPTIAPTPTDTLEPDVTLSPTVSEETPASTATTAPVTGNDSGTWRAQDPADNTEFTPGEEFTVTWTIENTGSTTWTTDYYIEFASGEQMDAEDQIFLPYPVQPDTNVQISVVFTAPSATGEYQSDWNLVNANGVEFSYFYVIINVVEKTED